MDYDSLAECAKDDRKAFETLYRGFYSSTYNYIRFRCDDRATAEDLTSRVFARLLERLPSYASERGPFKPWFYALTRNVLADHFRAQRLRLRAMRHAVATLIMDSPSLETAYTLRETEDEVLQAIKKLKPRDRDVLGLKFGLSMSHADIAAMTGLSESNVGVIVFRSLNRLRVVMEQGAGKHPEEVKGKHEATDHG